MAKRNTGSIQQKRPGVFKVTVGHTRLEPMGRTKTGRA